MSVVSRSSGVVLAVLLVLKFVAQFLVPVLPTLTSAVAVVFIVALLLDIAVLR